jgi:hypothetical protein
MYKITIISALNIAEISQKYHRNEEAQLNCPRWCYIPIFLSYIAATALVSVTTRHVIQLIMNLSTN